MADFSALIQRIKDAVYENGVQAITGQILQDCLKDVVNTVNVAKQDGIYRVTVTVDNNTGVPSGTARMDDDTYTLEFSFHNLKGEKGDKGDKGDTPVLTADSDGVIYSDGVMLTRVIKDTTDALTTRADSDHARAESDHARAETDHTDITRARLDAETAAGEANYASLRANTAADNADAAREAIQSDLAQKQDVIPDLQQIRAGAADTVKYTSQSLTDAQKTQARTNIAAASDSEVSQLRSEVSPLLSTEPKNFLLNNTGIFRTGSTRECYFVAVDGGSVWKIIAPSEHAVQYAFLKSLPTADYATADYATNSSFSSIAAGNIATGTVPSDAQYLYIANKNAGNLLSPESVIINGYDYIIGVNSEIGRVKTSCSQNTQDISTLNTHLVATDSDVDVLKTNIGRSFSSVLTPGDISSGSGQDKAGTTMHRSKYFECATGGTITGYLYRVYCYDEDLSYLGQEGQSYAGTSSVSHTIATQNVAFVRVTILNANVTKELLVDGYNAYDKTYSQVLSGVKLGSNAAPISGSFAVIPAASSSGDGFMSKEDKIKLDNMTGEMSISISGSGIAKNASAYGFLPTNTAHDNSVALQSCLDGGGLIVIDLAGIYEIDSTHYLDSNTHIVFGENVYIKRVLNGSNKCPRHIFTNRGATSRSYNSDIIIDNMKILPNGALESGHSLDVSGVAGLRGLLAFFYVKNLVLNGIEIIDHDYAQFSIHICTFENIQCNRIHIETKKDGIHFGRGRGFVVSNSQFLTDDDALAFNAIDYPTSNPEFGWIEDGIVENITFLKKPSGSAFRDNRGVLLLSGAWKEWESGMSFQTNGDVVASNGNLYQTYISPAPSTREYLTSTVQPTHTSGTSTGADGITWLYKGPALGYSAGVRRVHFRNLFVYRKTPYIFLITCEQSAYVRSYYPNATLFKNENLTFEGVYNLNESEIFLYFLAPVDNVRFINNDISGYSNSVINLGQGTDVPSDMNVHIALVGNSFADSAKVMNKAAGSWAATLNLVGSLKASDFTPVYNGIVPTFINNDME